MKVVYRCIYLVAFLNQWLGTIHSFLQARAEGTKKTLGMRLQAQYRSCYPWI